MKPMPSNWMLKLRLAFLIFIICGFAQASPAEPSSSVKIDESVIQANDTMTGNLRRLIGFNVALSIGGARGLVSGIVLAVSDRYVHIQRTLDRSQFDSILEIDQINSIGVVIQ